MICIWCECQIRSGQEWSYVFGEQPMHAACQTEFQLEYSEVNNDYIRGYLDGQREADETHRLNQELQECDPNTQYDAEISKLRSGKRNQTTERTTTSQPPETTK